METTGLDALWGESQDPTRFTSRTVEECTVGFFRRHQLSRHLPGVPIAGTEVCPRPTNVTAAGMLGPYSFGSGFTRLY